MFIDINTVFLPGKTDCCLKWKYNIPVRWIRWIYQEFLRIVLVGNCVWRAVLLKSSPFNPNTPQARPPHFTLYLTFSMENVSSQLVPCSCKKKVLIKAVLKKNVDSYAYGFKNSVFFNGKFLNWWLTDNEKYLSNFPRIILILAT